MNLGSWVRSVNATYVAGCPKPAHLSLVRDENKAPFHFLTSRSHHAVRPLEYLVSQKDHCLSNPFLRAGLIKSILEKLKEDRESNPVRLGGKHKRYPYAMPPHPILIMLLLD